MKILKPKHYLNRRLKPKMVGSVKTYPVYIRFTIGTSNHRVKSFLFDYLENEEQLLEYKNKIDLEKEVINYLYTRFHNYSFSNFNSDAFYLCSPLNVIIDMYINMYSSDGLDVPSEYYKKELYNYLLTKTNFPKLFLNEMIHDINFNTYVPSEFIKDESLKIVIESFNFCINFNENKPDLLCMYNWLNTNIKDEFREQYGSSYFKFVNNVVALYFSSLNCTLED
ncbi:hypothetical protein [Polaribacter sp. 20A6]|uniref:hypothetical protein n=1 Tax=Polaribacter sp. 20A6 TaxID=2687289 RepID=UPI0013FE3272|nr:hypothetical protein [Polaribacter sp. 20A6]